MPDRRLPTRMTTAIACAFACLAAVPARRRGLAAVAGRRPGRGVAPRPASSSGFPDDGLIVKWRAPVRAGFAGPAVADGRVFVLDYQETPGTRTMDGRERLVALDEETGAVLWTREWPATYRNIVPVFATGPRATPTVDGRSRPRPGRGRHAVVLRNRHRPSCSGRSTPRPTTASPCRSTASRTRPSWRATC